MTAGLRRLSEGPAPPARRVLFLAQIPPPLHGASAMSKRSFDIMQARGDLSVEKIWLGGAVTMDDVGRRSVTKYLGFARFLALLAGRWMTGKRYDLSYLTFAPFSHAAIRDGLLIAMAKLLSGRTLVHLHAERLEVVMAGATPTMRLLRGMVRGAELIAITDGVADSVRGTRHFAAIHVLPNCVDDPGEVASDRSGEICCGFLANLDPAKGVLRFLDGIEALMRRGVKVRGRIAGPSTGVLTIEALIADVQRRGLGGVVEVLGPLYGEEKIEFFRSLDVFLYLSQRDYFPLVVIEGMSCGVVPIVFDFAGQRELVNPAFEDHVVDPAMTDAERVDRICGIVSGYAADPTALAADRDKARAFFLANYTEDTYRERFHAILDGRTLQVEAKSDRV